MLRLGGILVGQRRQPAEPRLLRQRKRVEQFPAPLPRHDAPADHVEHSGAVVVLAPVLRRFEELADFHLDAIAGLQRSLLRHVVPERGGVTVRADERRGVIEVVFRHRVDAPEERAELGRAEGREGGVVHGDVLSALRHAVHNLHRHRALLPIEAQVVVVGMKLRLARMAVTRTVSEACDERVRRVLGRCGLELCRRVKERDDRQRVRSGRRSGGGER